MLRESPADIGEVNERPRRPQTGEVLAGKYRIEKVVGEGGMGVVFAARHVALDQVFAVKVLLTDSLKGDDVVERFVREAQAAARLQSEHVARVMDAGSLENGVPFLAMEYLEGCDLEELLKLNKQLTIVETVDYVLQALAAMGQAHAAGIVHRDLKPSNLFLALRPDGTNIIKILDFGISKQTAARREEKALTGRAVLGSPAYMPPEQLRNAKTVDARADLWALGIVLHELLAGVPPFDGDGLGEIFAAILEKEPSSLRAIRPDVPVSLEDAILKCLKRDVDQRWQTAGELARALVPHGSGKWSHVVEGIEQTLARSSRMRMQSPTGRNLIAAADQVLKSWRPPPPPDENAGPTSANVAFARSDRLAETHTGTVQAASLASRLSKRGIMAAVASVAFVSVLVGGMALRYLSASHAAPERRLVAVAAASPLPAPPPPAAVDDPSASVPGLVAIELDPPSVADPKVDPRPAPAPSGAKVNGSRARPVSSPQPGKPGTRPKFLNSRD